jgi:myo-inositol-1(or 4)-monophosphatase
MELRNGVVTKGWLADICKRSLPVVERAGDFIRSQVGRVAASQVEEKSLNSLVSYVDKEAEQILVAGLSQILPEAGFLTEEGTAVSTASSPWQWIIDPLDGTTNFLYSLPCFAVSVALAYDGVPMLGMVYEVNQREMYHAWKGGGAFCNGRPVAVSRAGRLEASLVATGYPYENYDTLSAHFSVTDRFQRSTRGIRRWGAASVDLCYVACGRYTIFFENTLNPWDVAAGILLVEEAGGKVTDFRGICGDVSGREVLATNHFVHEEALGFVRAGFYPDDVRSI